MGQPALGCRRLKERAWCPLTAYFTFFDAKSYGACLGRLVSFVGQCPGLVAIEPPPGLSYGRQQHREAVLLPQHRLGRNGWCLCSFGLSGNGVRALSGQVLRCYQVMRPYLRRFASLRWRVLDEKPIRT